MKDRPQDPIVAHYESCLEEHGDSHLGVDWPDAADARTRYEVMLDLIPTGRGASGPVAPGGEAGAGNDPAGGALPVLLDFGCGAAHLYDHLLEVGHPPVRYVGLDASERFVALCREKHPDVEFHCVDVLEPGAAVPDADWIVMNGVFTEKLDTPWDTMWEYVQEVVKRAWGGCRGGLAFNVMSKQVAWEREDLFHLSFDPLAKFLTAELSRHFRLRHDYGLYEYTAYVYRAPQPARRSVGALERGGVEGRGGGA